MCYDFEFTPVLEYGQHSRQRTVRKYDFHYVCPPAFPTTFPIVAQVNKHSVTQLRAMFLCKFSSNRIHGNIRAIFHE